MKNQNSIIPENYEEFISLTLRIRNSKKPSRTLARNGKHRWLPLCFARQARRVSMGRPVAKPMSSNQNLRVFWKPVNPQDCVWKDLYRNIVRTILQEEEDNSLQHYNLVHKFIPMPQAMKIPAPKAAVHKEWEKLEKIPARDLTRVRSNKEVIGEARTKGAKVHFASLMDICHLKNAELEAKQNIFKRSARRCPPRHSRRSAKRAMEQWVLHSQGTIAFCLHTLRKTVLFHAVVCLMFPVFWPWHCVFHAPVCYCHRDSLTRWRLALVQEAARVASSLSSHLFFEARCAL